MPPPFAPNATRILHALLLKASLSPLPPQLSFNSLLAASAASPHLRLRSLALPAFALVHRAAAFPLDSYAFCSALRAAASAAAAAPIHSLAAKSGWLGSLFVSCALAASYAKSGRFLDAHQLFDESPVKNTVFVNAVLSGYVHSRQWLLALEFVGKFQELGLRVDGYTMSAMVRVCGEMVNAGLGAQVHACAVRRVEGADSDAFLMSALVDMYAKCGLVGQAEQAFRMARRATAGGEDVVLWTAMLNAYGRHGRCKDVIRTYEEMVVCGVLPDELAVLAVLSACQHAGEVVSGLRYFESMSTDYGMVPTPEHCSCMIDMLCRTGEAGRAWEIASEKGSGGEIGVSMWGALLSACRDRGNVEIGRIVAQKALELEPGNVGIYVELSNLYARTGLWEEIGELREVMKEKGLEKDVGSSWIEHRT